MRIGLAVGYFDPQVGGSEEVVKQLAMGLRARGHDVQVATSVHPERRQAQMVAPVVEFAVTGNASTGIRGDVLGYQHFLGTSDRDVWLFYAAQIWTTDLALPMLASMPAATIFVPCGYSELLSPAWRSYFEHLPEFLQRADALVYMSSDYQDWEHDQSAGLGPIAHVIPNAASEEEFHDLHERQDDRPGRLVITVANHIPAKGHDAVVRAFRASAGPDDRLVIIGNRFLPRWKATCWLRCRLASMRDRRISLAEGLPRREVVRLYKEADVFLFGSRVECAPLVLIEAMAAGLPFVTTAVGNARDYADAGVVCDEQDLAQGLARLLAAPGLRARLGARGRARWERDHRWSTVVDQYEALFEAVIGAKAGPSSA